ncbi:MAG: hypothetical protein C0467_04845 [Planctomycetaceae bacterium]|nr:hypothetical protein [Planctomycetaceae bacterium]
MRSRFIATFLVCLGVPVTSFSQEPSAGTVETVGQPRYYFTLFAGQSVPFRPNTAHTWGTYTKVTPTADGGQIVEPLTISWLPADANVQPYRLRPVTGKNWSLEETLAIMASHNSRVSRWGPYEVDANRFELAKKQAAYLASGEVKFRSIDSFNTNEHVVNCVHALTSAGPAVRHYIQPVLRVGEPGTSRLAKLYLRGGSFPTYPETHDWLLPLIGADGYPITSRQPGERIPRQVR